jgi:integrase
LPRLRTFYRFLIERHGLATNPLKQVQLPKLDRKLPVVLTAKQIVELLEAPLKVEKAETGTHLDAPAGRGNSRSCSIPAVCAWRNSCRSTWPVSTYSLKVCA